MLIYNGKSTTASVSILEAVIGFLAPPQCISCAAEGDSLCSDCSGATILPFGERCWRCNSISPRCRTCQKCQRGGSPAHVWLVTDYDGTAKKLLALYKFGHQRIAAESIARMMAEIFRRHNGAETASAMNYLAVPVPTATSRVRERGFGHSELLAKQVSVNLRIRHVNALRRLGQSRQVGARREQRLVQLAGGFAVKNPKLIKGRNILLIDDVVTTGGTLLAATKVLKAAGAKQVDALLFAKRL